MKELDNCSHAANEQLDPQNQKVKRKQSSPRFFPFVAEIPQPPEEYMYMLGIVQISTTLVAR